MACSSSCPTQDHSSYGQCLRSKGIQIDRYALVGNNLAAEKVKNQTLARFRDLAASGITAQSPLPHHVAEAERTGVSADR